MEKEYTYKRIWIITYPVLISLLIENLIGITDTAFLGRLGEVELGASALGGIFYMIAFMVGFGFAVGTEILIGRRNGEGHFKAIGNLFFHSLLTLSAMAILIILFSTLFAKDILRLIISSDEVYQATIDYTQWRIYGIFFSFIVVTFRAYYMGTTNTKILTLNSIVMVGSNIILNYALIFGKFGFPAMGIIGCAIASGIAELIAALFFILYSRYFTNYSKYGLYRWGVFRIKTIKEIVHVSKWTMFQFFVSSATWLFFFLAIEHLGERELAISNIVRNSSMVLYLFVSAFATTGIAMISNLIGRGEQDKVMGLCFRIIKLCAICTTLLLIPAALFPEAIVRVYTSNPELIAGSINSLRVMLTSYIFGVPAFVFFLAIAGTGNTKVTFWIEVITIILYSLFISYFVFYLHLDVAICWTVEIIYCFSLLLLSFFYMKSGKWRDKKI